MKKAFFPNKPEGKLYRQKIKQVIKKGDSLFKRNKFRNFFTRELAGTLLVFLVTIVVCKRAE